MGRYIYKEKEILVIYSTHIGYPIKSVPVNNESTLAYPSCETPPPEFCLRSGVAGQEALRILAEETASLPVTPLPRSR